MARGRTKKESDGKISVSRGEALPLLANQSFAAAWPERVRGRDGYSSCLNRFGNLKDGIMPFQTQGNYITIKDAIYLCQKAYFNVSIFRNAINTLAELCNTELYLEGGNEQSKGFFEAWLKRINLWKLKDMFFREIFRSGNVFLFRVDGQVTREDALKLNQTYGASLDLEIPLRYIILNVADIAALNGVSYDSPTYFKILTPQQLEFLKKSKNPDDKEVFKNLPTAIKDYFDGAATGSPVPIDLDKLHTVFYQKQDYEPFAIPIGFGVLDDLNLKLEFKRTDAILARTVEFATLIVTQGWQPDEHGQGGASPQALAALREMFSKEQIGRVLVADFSTKAEWAIPDLSKVMGPQKYQMVNDDIAAGLMDLFFGEQKFANVAIKLKVFVQKLNRVQEMFLNDFLQPEIKRISEMMNFKSYPVAKFIKTNLDDQTQMMRILTQLMQLGILTAKDGIDAIEKGELPEFEKLVENQTELKKLKDKGLFQPVIGGVQDQLKVAKQQTDQQVKLQESQQEHNMKLKTKELKHAAENPPAPSPSPIHINLPGTSKTAKQPTGRPAGSKAPQTTKKVSPIGTASEQKFSMKKLLDNIKLMDKVKGAFLNVYKKEKGIKRMTEPHQKLIDQLTKTLFENESAANWENKIEEYIKEPIPPDIDKALEIEEISQEYDLSNNSAILLYHSKVFD